MRLIRPIDTRDKYDFMMSFEHINTINRENRHLVHNFYVTYLSNRYLCMTCPDSIWAALQSIKQLIQEDGASILEAIAAQEVTAYQQTKEQTKEDANPFSEEELTKVAISSSAKRKKKKDE